MFGILVFWALVATVGIVFLVAAVALAETVYDVLRPDPFGNPYRRPILVRVANRPRRAVRPARGKE